jgi:hypothetical protein
MSVHKKLNNHLWSSAICQLWSYLRSSLRSSLEHHMDYNLGDRLEEVR